MRPSAVGLHIYSGALTLGVSTRFDIVGQWEEGPWGAETFRLNFPTVPHPLTRDAWPVAEHAGKVQLVFSNPPCAPWSSAGAHLGVNDPRLTFTHNSVDAALALRPEVFIIESVTRAWSPNNGGRELYTAIARRFGEAGYQVTVYLTNALLVGGTQHRDRFHLIAHRGELTVPEPTVTARDVPTVRDLIGDIEHSAARLGEAEPTLPNHAVRRPATRYLNVIERLAQGDGWDDGYARAIADGVEARKHRVLAQRIRYDAPSPTLADIGCIVHPTANRMLTAREGARLCGYPDSFVFAPAKVTPSRSYDTKLTDITQIVLPPVGEHLAALALRSLDAGAAQAGELSVVDHRSLARGWSPGRWANKAEQSLTRR